jgi:hypothetical protein
MVQEVLIKAISKIHISCDLWTSLNRYAICRVTVYFISYQGQIQNVLLTLKRVKTAYEGEQIAEVIITVL